MPGINHTSTLGCTDSYPYRAREIEGGRRLAWSPIDRQKPGMQNYQSPQFLPMSSDTSEGLRCPHL